MDLSVITLIISQGELLFNRNENSKRLPLLQTLLCYNTRRRHIRIPMYEEIIGRYLHDDFYSHFRMSRTIMEILINIISGHHRRNFGRPQVPAKIQCMVCVWVLANQESYRSIADRFDLSKSSVFHCLLRICTVLNKMASKFIKWPQGKAASDAMEGFHKMKGFPNVLGAIDGCHIYIRPPKHNSAAYTV